MEATKRVHQTRLCWFSTLSLSEIPNPFPLLSRSSRRALSPIPLAFPAHRCASTCLANAPLYLLPTRASFVAWNSHRYCLASSLYKEEEPRIPRCSFARFVPPGKASTSFRLSFSSQNGKPSRRIFAPHRTAPTIASHRHTRSCNLTRFFFTFRSTHFSLCTQSPLKQFPSRSRKKLECIEKQSVIATISILKLPLQTERRASRELLRDSYSRSSVNTRNATPLAERVEFYIRCSAFVRGSSSACL